MLTCENLGVPYSGNWTLSPYIIAILDFICLFFFLYFRWFKTKWEKKQRKCKMRNLFLCIFVCVIVIDNSIAIYFIYRP